MDFCSIKAGIVKKTKELVQKNEAFRVDGSNVITKSDKLSVQEAKQLIKNVNNSFGGEVVSFKRGIYSISPARNVVNAYLLETKKDLFVKAAEVAKETLPSWMLQAFNSNPKQALLEAVQQYNLGNVKSAEAFYGKELINVALQIFEGARFEDTLKDYSFNDDVAPNVIIELNSDTFYNLKSSKNYNSLQEVVLHRMATSTKMRSYRNIVSKINNNYYITFTDAEGLNSVDKNVKRFNYFLDFNEIPKNLFSLVPMVSASGTPGYYVNKASIDIKDTIAETKKKDKIDAIIAFLSERFGYKGEVVSISRKDFNKLYSSKYGDRVNSVVIGNKIYLITEGNTNDITTEELLHPFINALATANPTLFNSLLREVKRDFPQLVEQVNLDYKDESASIRNQEIVAKALARVFNNEFETTPAKSLKEVVGEFTKWLLDTFKALFSYYNNSNYTNVHLETLDSRLTLEQLAKLLNSTDSRFDTMFGPTFFSIETAEPKLTNDIYESINKSLTDKELESSIGRVILDLPKAISEIKRSLDKEKDTKTIKILKSALNDIYAVQNHEAKVKTQFRTIVTVVNILSKVRQKIELVDKSGLSPNNAIIEYNAIYKLVKSTEAFQENIKDLFNVVEPIKGRTPDLGLFYNILREAIATPQIAESRITELVKNPLIEVLADYNEPFYKKTLDRLKEEKKALEIKLATEPNIEKKARISKKISQLNEDMLKLPTKETFVKIFEGAFKDANQISLWLESGIVNGHPLVSSLMSIIEDVYYKANQDLLKSRTGYQLQIDKLIKVVGEGLRDQEKLYKPITVLIKRPISVEEIDGKPDFKYVEQRALLNYYDGKYIQEIEEMNMYVQHLFNKLIESRSIPELDKREAEEARLTKLHEEAVEKKYKFHKDNSEREYVDEVYQMFELQDKVIGIDPVTNENITIRSLKGNIYQRIEDAEKDLKKNFDTAARNVIINHIALLRAELRQLKNPFDEDFKPKTGLALDIVNALVEYNALHLKYGNYVMTPQSQSEFDTDLKILEEEYAKGEISKEQYERNKSLMTKDEIHPNYYLSLNMVYAEINEIMENILNIPEFANSFNKESKDKIKEGYSAIKDAVLPYRDADGVIDGELMTQAVPKVVKKIKEIQEALEIIKEESQKLSGLSIKESMELSRLGAKLKGQSRQDETFADEFVRYNELQEKLAKIKANATIHKDLLESLNKALDKINKLTEGSKSHYYYDAVEAQLNEIKAKDSAVLLKVETLMRNPPSGEITLKDGGTYERDVFGKWSVRKLNETTLIEERTPLYDVNDPTDTGDSVVRSHLLNVFAKQQLSNTDWWKDNHFTQLVWDAEEKSYFEVERPIYIWEKQTPRSAYYINKDQPSIIYRKYEIKDKDTDEVGKPLPGYINKNYKIIQGKISAPKNPVYANKEYERMASSKDPKDVAYMEFLEFARANYQQSQKFIKRELGDMLPSVVKTSGENMVNATNSFLTKDFSALVGNNILETDDDNATLLGGSMKKTKGIPVRFISKIDKSSQSANIPAMLLVFELASIQNNKLNENLPIFESIQNLAGKAKVTESINVANKLNFIQGFKQFFKKDGKSTVSVKDVKQSNLSKTVDNFIDMFVYGRTTNSSTVNVGGKIIDINKIAGGVMSFAANSVFIGNIFSAVKNSISTRIQTSIQANVKQGIYSQGNLNKAHAQAYKYIPQLLEDYMKVGNKSLFGQVLDYFSVMPENINGQFTSKTEFTALKEKMTLMSSPKAMSEFEIMVVQFLTFANNKMVKVGDKSVPLGNIEEIFEKGPDQVIRLKKGVSFPKQEEAAFIKVFRKYTREIAGAYRQNEQTQLETGWGGKLVMYMHKYLAPGISNRYAGRRYSIEEGDITEGYYNTSIKNLVSLFKEYSGNVTEKWDDMSTMEQAHFIKFCKEMGYIIALLALTTMLGSGDTKKELEENTWAYNFILAELMAVKTENETFAFAIGSGLDDLIRIVKNPIIASQQIGNVYKLFPLLFKTIINSDDAYYKQNSGLHEQGDSKLFTQFLKVLGYTGKFWDGPEMVKQQQMIQTLR